MENSKNKPYEFTGIVHQIDPLQTFASGFAKRTLIVCQDPTADYPNYAAFEFLKTSRNDSTELLDNLRKGQRVCVHFYVNANESKKNPGSWFCSLRGVDIDKFGVTDIPAQSRSVPEPATPPASYAAQESASDDLPF